MVLFLKKKFIFLLFLFFCMNELMVIAQTTEFYINQNCLTVPFEKAIYKRKVAVEKMAERPTYYYITDYLLTGEPFMEAVSISSNPVVFNGKCSYYYKNGRKKSEGNFSENVPSGNWTYWSEDGLDSMITEFDIFGKQTILSNTLKPTENPDYAKVEIDAEFPGGTKAINAYISQNLIYPKEALARNIHGKVIVDFEVNQTGKIQNSKALTTYGFGMEAEALRLVSAMPSWIPARAYGINIIVPKTMIVTFRIP